MKSYDFLINHLPTAYRGEINTQKQMKIWGELFDFIISYVDSVSKYFYIDTATEEWLELLGNNVGRPRKAAEELEIYRKILKIQYYNTFIVPTHNNLLKITKNITGEYPILKPLWEQEGADYSTSDAAYYLGYNLEASFPTTVLDELEKFYAAGVKIEREDLFEVGTKDTLVAGAIYNNYQTIIGFKGE